MTLKAIKTTAGYIVEGQDATGRAVEMFFDNSETFNFDRLSEMEDSFKKNAEFQEKRAALPDPERDLYLTIFGSGNEPADAVLHTTLAQAQDAQSGLSLDWTVDGVTAALRLITTGNSKRLRLIAGRLVDTGPAATAPPQASVSGGVFQGNPITEGNAVATYGD